MALKKDFFLSKLFNINLSDDSLKALALYIKTYEDEYKTIVEGFKYVYDRSSIHYRLVLCILIDKIIELEIKGDMREELKNFVNENFVRDLILYEKHEFLKQKIDELMKSWKDKDFIIEN